uniref:U3 small nucleolar RNA-associated protein NOL7 C-terminal domain-containing protein n=1 Tax=Oreochromis aureus TaxID=47969 RepID=A0A668U0L0_OREAU
RASYETAARLFLSTSKTADIEKPTESFTLSLESSDDEAPEEVTFEDSKAEALRSMKQALDTARREKELLKEKRRKRQELFQEQKVSVCHSKWFQIPSEAWTLSNPEFLYTVTTVKERTLASFQQQVAEEFIRSRLYGPGTCRTTSNEMLSLQNKKGWNKSAAVHFVKKDWGTFRTSLRLMTRGSLLQLLQSSYRCNVSSKDKKLKRKKRLYFFLTDYFLHSLL